MIIFNTIRWKNFLSTGNQFTEIKLDRSPSTLIVGENGGGKSTMLDALCFSLFGKPFRNINKPQLVNSINKKQLLVEVEFHTGSKLYKIVRGIKPGLFEIYVDGELLNQDAAARDYQKYLEESILKLNYKSFTQIVILGSASFTPFMQLPSGTRREIIEDLLDIQIFTTMNVVLRDKMNALKDQLQDADGKLEVLKQKASIQKEYVDTLEANREKRVDEILERIETGEGKISSLTNLTNDLAERNSTPLKPNFPHNSVIFKKRLLSTRKQMSVLHVSKGLPTTIKKLSSHQDKRKFKNSLLEWRNSKKNLQNLKNSLRKMRFFPNKFLG